MAVPLNSAIWLETMSEHQRFTTEFVEVEDRIRLIAEIKPGEIVILWLTQRLLTRLLPHLLSWLEQRPEISSPAHLCSDATVRQSFAQQVAAAEMAPQPPLKAGVAGCSWLVGSVDVLTAPNAIVLTFKGGKPEESTCLRLSALPLRQWIAVVHSQWRLAQWSMAVWPQWVSGSALLKSAAASNLVH